MRATYFEPVYATEARSVLTGPGAPLPHLDRIQQAFGPHDLSGVRAHVGGASSATAHRFGARAYTLGEDVVLGAGGMNLRTVAHEAAHVIQQRAGVVPAGSVGRRGDRAERQADEVASRVVRGESAVDLLPHPTIAARSGRPALQFEFIQTRDSTATLAVVRRLAEGSDVGAMRALQSAIRSAEQGRPGTLVSFRVRVVAGGNAYDLYFAGNDHLSADLILEERIRELYGRARASAEQAAAGPLLVREGGPQPNLPSPFAQRFNQVFGSIIPALRDADPGSQGLPRDLPFTDDELRYLFSPTQIQKLSRYLFDEERPVPNHLFDGDDLGNLNARQRLVLSGRILTDGTYRPGSFSQRLYARYCGHWVHLVHLYAGVAPSGGQGIYGQLGHTGELVFGAGRAQRAAYSGERRPLPPEEQVGRRRFRRDYLSVDDFDLIQPGDWLYIHTDVDTPGGDHSVIFSHWIDLEPRVTEHGYRYRRAVTFDQRQPDQGGTMNVRNLGEVFGRFDGITIRPVTRVGPHDIWAHPMRTPEEFVAQELRHDPNRRVPRRDRRARAAFERGLGSGTAAAANLRTIQSAERRHRGVVDLDRLRRQTRRNNEALIELLDDATTEGKDDLLRSVNQSHDLETLVRLNERLNVYLHNRAVWQARVGAQRERIERQRAEMAEEVARQHASLEERIAILEGEIDRAGAVVALDRRLRELDREQRFLRRRIVWLRRQVGRPRQDPELRERRQRELDDREARLGHIEEVERPAIEAWRAQDAEVEAAQRQTTDIGRRSLPIQSRHRRLIDRRAILQAELAALDTRGGVYTAHPGSGHDLHGRRRAGETVLREPRVTGRLENLDPPVDWSEVMDPAPPEPEEVEERPRTGRRRRQP